MIYFVFNDFMTNFAPLTAPCYREMKGRQVSITLIISITEMKNKTNKGILSLCILMLTVICSCKDGRTSSTGNSGDTVSMKYAEYLKIIKYDGYAVAELADPWNKGKILHTYVLVDEKSPLPSKLPEGTLVRTPLKKAVVTTSVHCGLIMSFGKGESIRGVCDLKYINLPWIQDRCKKGKIADCGNGMTPTLEKIIDIGADAVIISPFQNSGGYGRLDEWKRPIIEAADYMETSALGRAEWMKFYGMLFGAEKQADSIFAKVETDYNNLKKIAESSKVTKSLLIDKPGGSVWYVPGGRSTIGIIMSDAGAEYPFASDKNSGSLALTFESVLEKASGADAWLIRYNSPQHLTYATLLSENRGYSQFKAFKDKEVYGCNTNFNTFYEDTPFHPELLLRDFIIISHPDLKNLGKPKYFERIK